MDAVFRVLLRRYRRAAGLTQEALAERALLSAQAISALERGTRTRPRRKTATLLADALHLTDRQRETFLAAATALAGDTIPEPAPDSATPRQLPAAIGDFTGREQQVTDLVQALTKPTDTDLFPSVRVAAIAGMAGVGKTTLAVRVGHLVGDQFPDGQLYLNLRGFGPGDPMPAIEALAILLRSLGTPPERVPTDVEEAAGHYRSALAGRRVLVVLDNAADAGQVNPLLPGNPGCAAVVTSRRMLSELAGAHHLQLDVLPETEALTLLGAIVGESRVAAEPDAARAVVRPCGYLPLAVRLAGARLATRPTWPIGHLASRLTDERRRLDELACHDTEVRASFVVSIRQLADGRLTEGFYLLGLPDCPDISTAAAARLLDRPERDTEQILERLVDLHLLDEPEPGRYRMHDLLRLFARERSAADLATATLVDAIRRLHDWYLASAWRANELLYPALTPVHSNVDPGQGLTLSTPAQAATWYRSEQENLLPLVRQLSRPSYQLGTLVLDLIDAQFPFLESAGRRIDVLEAGRLAMTVATRSGSPRALAQASLRLAAAYFRVGRYAEGIEAVTQSAAVFRDLGDDEGQTRAMNNLGLLYIRHGEPDRAAACFEQALAIRRRHGDRRAEAMILGNLGLARVALKAADAAIACNRRALAIYREIGDLRAEGVVLLNLGDAIALAGRTTEAVDHLERSLPLLREFSHRLGEAEALYRLGLGYRALGREQRAQDCWREAAALYDRLGAPEAVEVRALLGRATPAVIRPRRADP